MAFSGSTDYVESFTAASVIERALKRLGVMDASEPVDTTEQTDALAVLNLIVKEWSARGADVWLRNTGHLFLTSPGTVDGYTLGTSGTANFTSLYYTTTLASSAAAGATALTVTDDTNMSDTDILLVEQDDGTLHATTISGAPSSNSVTAATGLASSASSGKAVFSWPTTASIADKPTKIVYAARRMTNLSNASTNEGYMEGLDSPINIVGEDEYRSLSDKLTTGVPVSLFHKQEPVNPKILIWPTGGAGNHHTLVLEYNTYFQDLDTTTDNLDIPAEGANALAWQLAAELSAEYGIPEQEKRNLWGIATQKVEQFLDYQVEDASVFFARGYQ